PLLLAMAAFWLFSLAVPALCLLGEPSDTVVRVVKFNPLLRLPEFLVGIALGRLYLQRGPEARASGGWLAPTALAGLRVVLGLGDRLPELLLHDGLLAPLFAVLVYGLACGGGLLGRLLAAPVLVRLGEASYALYILHVPMRSWLYRALQRLGVDVEPSLPLFA